MNNIIISIFEQAPIYSAIFSNINTDSWWLLVGSNGINIFNKQYFTVVGNAFVAMNINFVGKRILVTGAGRGMLYNWYIHNSVNFFLFKF